MDSDVFAALHERRQRADVKLSHDPSFRVRFIDQTGRGPVSWEEHSAIQNFCISYRCGSVQFDVWKVTVKPYVLYVIGLSKYQKHGLYYLLGII